MKVSGLETLLDLDGHVLIQDHGCWVKIEARETMMDEHRPHGIRYSLTLHGPGGDRLMGYDNAHAVRTFGKKNRWYVANRMAYDHRHAQGSAEVLHYEFASPEQLLRDFFADVDDVLKQVFGK